MSVSFFGNQFRHGKLKQNDRNFWTIKKKNQASSQ